MKLKVQLSIWCIEFPVLCFTRHVPDGWLFITIWPTQALVAVIRTWKYWQSWDPCCEIWRTWKSKMSQGITLHSQVLTAKKVENGFNKVITVRNRLNINLLVNLPTRLACWSSVVILRCGLWCAHEADQGWGAGSQSSFLGHHPGMLLGSNPGACPSHCPGVVLEP